MYMNRHIRNNAHTRQAFICLIVLNGMHVWNAVENRWNFKWCNYVQTEPRKASAEHRIEGIYDKMQCLYLVLSEFTSLDRNRVSQMPSVK